MRLSRKQREMGRALQTADNKRIASLQSINVAFEVFKHVNERLRTQLNAEDTTPESEADLLLANAILVYEANDFLIRYLETFEVQGVKDIEAIHAQAIRDLEEQKLEQEGIKKRGGGARYTFGAT